MPTKRDCKTGKFVKTRSAWAESNWNDGFIDNHGRFRVYRPDYPNSYADGYCLRAHVVWWLHNGGAPPQKGTCVHHKNRVKTDDRIENLDVLELGLHTALHCKKDGVKLVCVLCNKIFFVPQWRINERTKNSRPPRYCSQECYHAREYSQETKALIGKATFRRHEERRKEATKSARGEI